MRRQLLLIPPILALAACATAPKPLQGEFSASTPAESVNSGARAERVRWGGEIVKVEPGKDSTCFEILSRDLDSSARPQTRDSSHGRFKACRAGFYDPEVFVRGRSLTVVGNVTGTTTGQVGQFDYTYPLVAADAVYLWPKRPLVVQSRDPWPYDPFWGPRFGSHWGGGWWGHPPVVIIKPRPDPKP